MRCVASTPVGANVRTRAAAPAPVFRQSPASAASACGQWSETQLPSYASSVCPSSRGELPEGKCEQRITCRWSSASTALDEQPRFLLLGDAAAVESGPVVGAAAFSAARRARSALLGRPRFFGTGTLSGTVVATVGSVDATTVVEAVSSACEKRPPHDLSCKTTWDDKQ